MKRFVFFAGMLLLLLLPCPPSAAQDVTEIQPLSFGGIALRDNDIPHSIILPYDGSPASYDAEIIDNPGAPPTRGEYEFTGLPPNVTFYVGISLSNPPTDGGLIIDNSTGATMGGSETFTIDSFTANDLSTDGAGNGTLYIGATLTTSGNGLMYDDGLHTGTFDVTLFY